MSSGTASRRAGVPTYYSDYRPCARLPYDAALGAVVGPCVAVLLAVGGRQMVGATAAMLLLGWLLEVLHIKEGSLVAMWLALVWVAYSFAGAGLSLVRHTFSNMFLLLHASFMIISVAFWISLQYQWFQVLVPGLAMLFERLLFSVTGLSAVGILSWALVVAFGIDGAPFYVFVVQHVVFTILFLPRFTAFRMRKENTAAFHYYISSFPESACGLISYLFLPVGVHLAMYHSASWDRMQFSSILLLVSLPLLGLRWMWPHKPLWFFEQYSGIYASIYSATLRIPAALMPLGLAWRILIPSHMADLAIPQPFGDLAVVGSLYCVVAVVALHRNEVATVRFAPLVHGTAAVVAIGACAFLNAPLTLWPVASVCGQALVWFYYQRKQRSLAYLVFVLGAAVCLVWFFNAKLSFVSFHFARIDLPLNNVLGLLACIFLGSFLLLYLMMTRVARLEVIEAAMLVYSCAFALAEWILAYGHGEVTVYPEWLVLGTSVMGIYFCRSAKRLQLVSRGGSWASACVWIAKVAPLLCPADDAPVAVFATLLILWTSAPILFYWHTPNAMRSGYALVHGALVGIAWLFAASTSLPPCHMSLLLGTAPDLDNPALFYGGAVAMWGLTLLVMSQRYFAARQSFARSISLLIMVTGFILVALQPSPILGAILLSASDFDVDELSGGIALWALVVVALLKFSIFIFPSVRLSLETRPVIRFGYAALLGAFASLYFLTAFVAPQGMVLWDWSGMLFVAAITVALVMSAQVGLFIMIPSKDIPSGGYLAMRFVVGSFFFPVCYGLAAVSLPSPLDARALTEVRIALLTWHCVLLFALSLALALQRARLSSKGGLASGATLSVSDRDAKRTMSTKPRIMGQVDPLERERLLVSNSATVFCVCACYALGAIYFGASPVSLLPLSTILMLYSSTRWSSPYLLPLGFGASSILVSIIWHTLFQTELHLSTFGVVKNLLLLLVSVPSVFFVIRGLVTQQKRDVFSLLLSCPGPCVCAVLGDVVPDIYVMAGFSVTGTLICYFWEPARRLETKSDL